MPRQEETLARCLSAMETGQSADDCLAPYGIQAAELRPLLALASDIRSVPVPRARPEARSALEQKMLAALDTRPSGPQVGPGRLQGLRAFWPPRPAFRWAAVMAAVLVLLLGGGWASVTVADRSLPGDLLHPLKLTHEWVQINLAIDPLVRQELRREFSRERLEEARGVLDQRRQTELEFAGELTLIADNRWKIEGFLVYLNSDTVVLGEPALGRQVRVKALATRDGELIARRLQVLQEAEPVRPGSDRDPAPVKPSGTAPLPSPTNDPAPADGEGSIATSTPVSTPTPPPAGQGGTREGLRQRFDAPTPPRPRVVPDPTGAFRERLRREQRATTASATPLHTRIDRDTPEASPAPAGTAAATPTATHQPLRTRHAENTPLPARTSSPEAVAATATPLRARESEHTPQASPQQTVEPDRTPEPAVQQTKEPGQPPPSDPPRGEQESQPPRKRSTQGP